MVRAIDVGAGNNKEGQPGGICFGGKKAWVTFMHGEMRVRLEEEETLRWLLGSEAADVHVSGEGE